MSVRRPLLLPFTPLYSAALRLQAFLRARGIPAAKTLPQPVVSIGSLSAGGAGKTPVVIGLAELLRDAGYAVDVLTRGYGRESVRGDGPLRVNAAAAAAARKFGDEPTLIARRAQIPVWVSADRFAAGEMAEAWSEQAATAHPAGRIHLLDDGFQHHALARQFEIVLVTADDLADTLLPAGNLREPLAALGRADAVIVRSDELAAIARKIMPHLRQGAKLWTVRRELRFPQPLGVLSAGLRPLAFCAIARPEGFAAALAAAGCAVLDTVVFPDHAPYGRRPLAEIAAFAKKLNASGLVTTEKDFVKLSPAAVAELESTCGPLAVVALDAIFEDPAALLAAVRAAVNTAGNTAGNTAANTESNTAANTASNTPTEAQR